MAPIGTDDPSCRDDCDILVGTCITVVTIVGRVPADADITLFIVESSIVYATRSTKKGTPSVRSVMFNVWIPFASKGERKNVAIVPFALSGGA
jgi:hypothetical protein